MNIPVDLLIEIIEKSEDCRAYLNNKYQHEHDIWTRFSKRNGKSCPFARAAIKRIFQLEYAEKGQYFLCSLGSQEWGSKKYQEGLDK